MDTAKKLLAELGFEDTDNNGILNWTTGPLAGQDLVLAMTRQQDASRRSTPGQCAGLQWGKVGIKLNFRPTSSQTGTRSEQAGEWDMHVSRGGQEWALPFIRCTEMAPITTNTARTGTAKASTPRNLQPFEEELVKISAAVLRRARPGQAQGADAQYNKIFTENNYTVGLIVGRYGENLTKRFQNVAAGLPAFLYSWSEDAIMSEQLWTPADQQQKQVRPNTVPTYPGSAI